MSSTSEKSSTPKSFLAGVFSVQNLVLLEIFWGVSALLFFLIGSIPLPGEELPTWYSYGTLIFELGAFLGATILCWRNWQNPQIVSGRNVWRGLACGMMFYFIGSSLFGWWEQVWHQEPIVSPGDLFYIISYVFIAWGMILAVISRRLNLEWRQWGIVGAIAAGGIALAIWISFPPAPNTAVTKKAEHTAVTAPAPTAKESKVAAVIKPAAKETAPNIPTATKTNSKPASPAKAKTEETVASEEEVAVPPWVKKLEKILEPLSNYVNLFYIVGDVLLLIIASTLLLAFWGGRFSQSWRMIAAATFSLYIADMWFKYAGANIPDYQSGQLLEVFFVFSGVLFGIGAILEHDLSTRSRRTTGRRRNQAATES